MIRKIKTHFKTFFERRFLLANCSTTLASSTAIISSFFSSATSDPISSLTDTSNISANFINMSASGTDIPFSHFEIVYRTTFKASATFSCVRPFRFLNIFKFLLNILWLLLSLVCSIYILNSCVAQATHINIA